MDIKEIFLKIFEQLKESSHSKFKNQSSEFRNVLNLPVEEIGSIIDMVLTPTQPITQGVSESDEQNLDNNSQTLLPSDLGKSSPESAPPIHEPLEISQGNVETLKGGQDPRKSPSPRKPRIHEPPAQRPFSGRTTLPVVDPSLPPTPISIGNLEPVDISNEEQVITTQPTIKRYSGKTKEFFDWAEKMLKNHYSGSAHIASVPCQICRYYCRECEMQGNVIDNYSCMATCKLEYYNLSGNLSCSKFTLWEKNEYLEKELSEISKDFFLGYMLILCHNHRTAFTQGKIFDIKEKIREQLYQKCVDEEYLENLEHSVVIGIDGLLNMEGKAVPMGIYISNEHLEFFKKTFDLML